MAYGKQAISQADIDAVNEVLTSEFLTQGPAVPKFEAAIAHYCDVKFASAVNSATSALHLACLALDVTIGDIVWTSPNTFVASSNCALYCGADVDFVDIDEHTGNMCVEALEKKLIAAKRANTLPKVVIPVHFAGQSCDMEAIYQLSLKYHFNIIEDASHAIGAEYKGAKIGNCQFSDICIFSFHPVKIITSGEGGMAVTNQASLDHKIKLLRSHGITKESHKMSEELDGPWAYQQIDLGFNYRMTDIHAALGLRQMQEVDRFVAQRHALAQRYDSIFDCHPEITPLAQRANQYSAFHLYIVSISSLTKDKKKHLVCQLREKGVGVHVHYIPVHLQPYYQELGFKMGDFPAAEQYYQTALTLPLHPQLTHAEQDKVIAALLAQL
ncbi:UDP-4-amino-4,6-dideoxy-N-acetyl-beta-L-altrosamine transaminase [Motilimonas pumila]|uniref:UDP-4-amino-4, 6-dideoxy-N-acetyl-beta-L-altrosamine transaminase n=1 Tax=Motilimonas pumila TaxID=2303987 RepID=A0A418YGX9_9GAMM|nr:UDP-4-amino-4,6-dideoxy-N-acetyl-beta-L-altrosamine transaminase [Motilimonas pumila]